MSQGLKLLIIVSCALVLSCEGESRRCNLKKEKRIYCYEYPYYYYETSTPSDSKEEKPYYVYPYYVYPYYYYYPWGYYYGQGQIKSCDQCWQFILRITDQIDISIKKSIQCYNLLFGLSTGLSVNLARAQLPDSGGHAHNLK